MAEDEACLDVSSDVVMEGKNSPKDELKRERECTADDAVPCSSPVKKQAIEASNEDTRSEVSNPTVCQKANAASFQDITSPPAESLSAKLVASGEVTSKCSANLSSEETLSNEEYGPNDAESNGTAEKPEPVITSSVVLEIPKHASTTGIRKITLKFSKRRENSDSLCTSSVVEPAFGHATSCLAHGSSREEQEIDFPGKRYPLSNLNIYGRNMELKMSKKVVPNSFPTNVKKLLSTGILEGARVKYVSGAHEELQGIVSRGGYLCGCSLCNFSKVVTAYEFEQHAGFKTKHPNNHIYLENGRSVYSIVRELKTAPLSVLEEVLKDVAGSAVNEEGFQVWKENLEQDIGSNEGAEKFFLQSRLSSQDVEGNGGPGWSSPLDNNAIQCEGRLDDHKRAMKKPGSYIYSEFVKHKKAIEGSCRRRDNDLHKLLFMPNGLPDGAELAYFVKGQRLLRGYKQANGIVCSCCDREISPSQFEAHAGMAVRRQPYRHIYTSNGLTLHDIALSLANGQNLAGTSDDMCTVCGEGGDLILCVGCPRAFHTACLGLLSTPQDDWCCSSCKDKSVSCRKMCPGDSNASRPIMIRLTRVVREPEVDIGGCCVCRSHDFSVGKFDEQTVMLCDQCEKECHVGCLREIGLCDLKELPKDKWFCCDDCDKIHIALQKSVSAGFQTILASSLSTINRKHIEKGLLIDGLTDDVQWRILSGKSRFPEDLPLLSRATAIFRECFDPIVVASGRDLIPVMVYGRNISGQEFGGMYCIVLTVKSVVVSAGLLRIFGREVAELPLVATSREHQGKGYFQALFSCIEGLLCSLNVEKLVLPAAEEAESIWTKRFCFRKMSDEHFKKHMGDHQLTIFKGTSMLEKEVLAKRD